jgi:hypothetical protein
MAEISNDDWWTRAPFDGHGAFALEFSEGPGSRGAGALTDVGRVNENGLSPWTTSSAVVGEYGAQGQQEFLPYTDGARSAQPPYDPRIREYVELNGGGEFSFGHSRGLRLTISS